MHSYSLDARRYFYVGYMGVAAFGASLVLNQILKNISVPVLVDHLPPLISNAFAKNSFFITVTLLFTVFFYTYNSFLWSFTNKASDGGIPDLRGFWVRTDIEYDTPDPEEYTANLSGAVGKTPHLAISQTWTEIEAAYIDLNKEYWRSDAGALHIDDGPNPELICNFQSESYDDVPVDFDRGTLRVRYFKSDGADKLIGHQYTDSSNERRRVEFERHHKINSLSPITVNIEGDDEDSNGQS